MQARWWGALTLLVYVSIVAANLWWLPSKPSIGWRIGEYSVLATLLLGYFARQFSQAGSLVWRPVMLFTGAAMAAANASRGP